MEAAGKTDDALGAYASALEVRCEYLPAIQGTARLFVRAGRADDRLPCWLELIALRSLDPDWQNWARMNLAKRP